MEFFLLKNLTKWLFICCLCIYLKLLGNPYTISPLSQRGTTVGGGPGHGPGFPRGGRLSDAIASLYGNPNGNGNRGGGGGGNGSVGGGPFIHANRYNKNDFQRYYH